MEKEKVSIIGLRLLRVLFKQPLKSPQLPLNQKGSTSVPPVAKEEEGGRHHIFKPEHRFMYVAKAVLMGLLTTQLIATFQVYLSDLDIYKTTKAIADAGYLPIPNSIILPSLKEWGPAIWGGLFFTLSIGTGLSILAVICAWAWGRLLRRHRIILIILVLAWISTIILANRHGFAPMVSLYFIFVPCVAFLSTLKWMPTQATEKAWLKRLCFIVPITTLTVIWALYANATLFLDIRDFLLLSNPIGQKIDSFYYRYTLYPAEVFKSLDQKTLKTYRLSRMNNQKEFKRLERVLLNHDYLPIDAKIDVDLEIQGSDGSILFMHKGKTVLETTIKKVLSRPGDTFSQLSITTDRFVFFSRVLGISVLVGFPVFLYIMVFALVKHLSGLFLKETTSYKFTAPVAFIIGLLLLLPFLVGNMGGRDDANILEGLHSDTWQKRVYALRAFINQKLEIGNMAGYKQLLASPYVPERYWLAQALGNSKDPKTYPDLVALLNDPHPNVVSMALRSLGQRRDKRAINEILAKIERSDHWYNQWYAYRALKSLGWRQSKPGNN